MLYVVIICDVYNKLALAHFSQANISVTFNEGTIFLFIKVKVLKHALLSFGTTDTCWYTSLKNLVFESYVEFL